MYVGVRLFQSSLAGRCRLSVPCKAPSVSKSCHGGRVVEIKNRRLILSALASATGAAALAACGGDAAPAAKAEPTKAAAPAAAAPTTAPAAAAATKAPEPTKAAAPAAAPAAKAAGKLEIFSWWTNPGEVEGLDAMFKVLAKEAPEVKVTNAAIAGGAGAGGDMKAVLATRMNAGNPPDSFQVHLGKELTDGYAKADKMEDLTFLFESEGWTKTFPKGLLDAAASGGKQYSVPVNIHRSNVMWFNKKIMADNGITAAPATFDEWFAMAEKLKAKGIPALAMGASSAGPDAHLFENILAGVVGADGYSGLWNGKTMWSDAKVTTALETFKKMIGYANKDYLQIVGWDAGDYIISGKAATYIMGDWMNGFYKAKKFADLGYAPPPGTKGTFVALSDSFGLPKKAPNRDASIAWLKVCGSVAGQDAFNPVKGSIPARTDAGKTSDYDEYQKSAMKDWTTDKIVPSLVHGFAGKQSWVTDWQNAVNSFASKLDVKATQDELVKIAKDALG